jgi:hypothetical protein
MSDDRPPTVVVQPAQGVVAVATDTIGALRGYPVLLVMVILNCVFIAAAAYYLRVQQDNAYKLVGSVLEHCLPDHRSSFNDDRPARPFTPPPGYPDHWSKA